MTPCEDQTEHRDNPPHGPTSHLNPHSHSAEAATGTERYKVQSTNLFLYRFGYEAAFYVNMDSISRQNLSKPATKGSCFHGLRGVKTLEINERENWQKVYGAGNSKIYPQKLYV